MECYIWNTQLAGIWLTSHIWDIGLVLKGLKKKKKWKEKNLADNLRIKVQYIIIWDK
jgi:hypothetical protein